PRLIAVRIRTRHGEARAGRDDLAALHSLVVDRGRRQVEPDVRALLAFLDVYEDAIADDDQLLVVLDHRYSVEIRCLFSHVERYQLTEGAGTGRRRVDRNTG